MFNEKFMQSTYELATALNELKEISFELYLGMIVLCGMLMYKTIIELLKCVSELFFGIGNTISLLLRVKAFKKCKEWENAK